MNNFLNFQDQPDNNGGGARFVAENCVFSQVTLNGIFKIVLLLNFH